MSILEFSGEWLYWGPVLSMVVGSCWAMRAKLLDFGCVISLILSQYVVHAVIVFGWKSEISAFCILFLSIFVAFVQRRVFLRSIKWPHFRGFNKSLAEDWISISKWYLLIYYSCRLIFYPFFSGELLLDDRLSAQKDNGLLFVLGLAVTPAIAAVMYALMRPGSRMSMFDKLVLVVVSLGFLGSGSKAGLIPIILVYFGVSSCLRLGAFRNKGVMVAILFALGGTLYILRQFFPVMDYFEIGGLMLYRLAANTDSLEYIDLADLAPGAYPYAGLGALFPALAKRLGYVFEYPPGVWLHGVRFDNWDGFGPNSGVVMDFFGNLGWMGLFFAGLLGLYVRGCRRWGGVIGCSFLSIAYLVVTDIALFDIAFVFWLLVLVAMILLRENALRLWMPLRWLHRLTIR